VDKTCVDTNANIIKLYELIERKREKEREREKRKRKRKKIIEKEEGREFLVKRTKT